MAAKKTGRAEDAFARVVDDYPDEFLSCRDYGHGWVSKSARWEKDGTISRTLRCARCDAERSQVMDRDGYVIAGNDYRYQQGYLIPGVGRLTAANRAALRISSVLKNMVDSR